MTRHAAERFGMADHFLATHPGRIKERLLIAMREANGLLPGEFPDESTLERWESIDQRMTEAPMDGHEGLYAAAVHAMTEEEAAEAAADLHSLASKVRDFWTLVVGTA